MEKSRQGGRSKERKLRARYRRNIALAILVSLVVGLAAGFWVGRIMTVRSIETAPAPTMAPTPVPAVKDDEPAAKPEVTAEPAVQTEAEPAAAPVTVTADANAPEVIVVPFGITKTVPVEVHADGTIRSTPDALPYETLNLEITVQRYLTNDYYMATYGERYHLNGDESSVEFELLLKDYMGTQEVRPNDHNLLNIKLETYDGTWLDGNRVQDREIEGTSDITITTNVPTMLYKRFTYDPVLGDARYLVISTYDNGVAKVYKFELGDPQRPGGTAPAGQTAEYTTLKRGDKNDAVKALQEALIAKGYLDDTADGGFGKKTEDAVEAAQKDMGLEVTGVADPEFQKQLFS